MKTKFTIALLMGALTLSTVAEAQPGPGGPGRGQMSMLDMFSSLSLTDSQEAALSSARSKLRSQRSGSSDRGPGQGALSTQLKSQELDVSALYEEVEARATQQKAEIDAFASVYETLSSSQKEQLAEQLSSRSSRGGRGGPGGQGGGGGFR